MRLRGIVAGAVAVAAAAWVTARTVQEIVRAVGESTTAAQSSTLDGMERLLTQLNRFVGTPELDEEVDQLTDEQVAAHSLITPAEEFEASFDDEDWTDRAQAEISPGLDPPTVLVPIEDRHVGPSRYVNPPDGFY